MGTSLPDVTVKKSDVVLSPSLTVLYHPTTSPVTLERLPDIGEEREDHFVLRSSSFAPCSETLTPLSPRPALLCP